jgi:protease I
VDLFFNATLKSWRKTIRNSKELKALIIRAENFEDPELLIPYQPIEEARVAVDAASIKLGAI